MKYLKSYQPFLESTSDQQMIDMFKSVEDLTKGKKLSQQEEEKIAKDLVIQLEKNPKISKEIKDAEQKMNAKTTNEAHGGSLMIEFLHKLEYGFETAEHIETVGHDIVPDLVHDEVKSKLKKVWAWVYSILHSVAKGVGWLFDLFEKGIMWVANKIFGADLETSYKLGKWTFCAISFVIAASAAITIAGLTAGATSVVAFISSLFTKGLDVLSKLKAIAQSTWSFIKKVIEIDKTESGELLTPVEFFNLLNKTSVLDECPDINTSTQKDLQSYFDRQHDKTKTIISEIFKSLIMTEDLKKWQKAGLETGSGSVLKSDLNLRKIKDIPFLRKLFSPILLSSRIIPSGKVRDFEVDTIDDFARKISGKYIEKFGDYLKNSIDVIKKRFGKDFFISDNAKSAADKLHTAMDGTGTYEDDIYEVFQKINNELEFWKIYFAFGLRSESDLIEWLFDDLNQDELLEVSKILSKIDWKEGFDVSKILKGQLVDYHRELPQWSLCRKNF